MENYGIAHFSRKCPKCQQLIHAGSRIARQMINGRAAWVHDSCFMPAYLAGEMERLDAEFLAAIDRPSG